MPYVDGFVLPVPKKNLKAYARMAAFAGKIWKEHGALEFRECAGDDLNVQWGVPFAKMMKLKPGETVMFSYIVFKSRAHRDRVNAKVMQDPGSEHIKSFPAKGLRGRGSPGPPTYSGTGCCADLFCLAFQQSSVTARARSNQAPTIRVPRFIRK